MLRRPSWVGFVAIISLLVNLSFPAVAFADDDPPPAPEVTESAESNLSSADEGGETPIDESSSVEGEETPAASEEVAEAESTETESETPDLTVSEALEQAPEGTELIVLGESGEPLPLVSEEVADVLIVGDPVWCPDGQAPTPGANDCTASYTSLQDLLNYLAANQPSQAGVIWIEDSYDSSVGDPASSGFTLDGGTTFTTMKDYGITVQGGWDGVSGSSIVSGSSLFSGDYLHILNWDANVTLNDILVDGAADTGIKVTTNGDINAENIQSSNNTGSNSDGAFLDNYRSNPANTGNITLTGANTFNNNGDWGLDVQSNQQVTTNNLTANGNSDGGAYLYNSTAGSVMEVKGANVFNGNGTWGFVASNKSDLNAENITANNNGSIGAILETSALTAPIALAGTNTFNGNGDEGLRVLNHYSISVENITANDNGGDGAFLFDIGSVDITVSGTNSFNGNDERGLHLLTYGGIITLNNITANGNSMQGLYLQGDTVSSNSIALTLTGTNEFSGNGGNGFQATGNTVRGQLSLNNVTASSNSGIGVYLDNSASVTEAGITFTGVNTFSGNSGDGISVESTGVVSLENMQSNNNGGHGIDVDTSNDIITNNLAANQNDNWGATLTSNTLNHSVTMNGINTFNENTGGGLSASARSDLTLNNITANDNGLSGMATQTFSASTIRLAGVNVFNNNLVGWSATAGASTFVENVTANDNERQGIYLLSIYDGNLNSSNVTVNGNGYHGLEVSSRGDIMLSDVIADGNGQHGVFLHDLFGIYPTESITVTGTNTFSNNGFDGFRAITASDVITLNNVTASDNGDHGVFLNNTASAADAGITITGTNVFNGNLTYGLQVTSDGSISINNATASGNTYDGANLDNRTGAGGVTITGENVFTSNGGAGIDVQSLGDISFEELTTESNLYGAILDNCQSYFVSLSLVCAGTGSITSAGSIQINGNASNGLQAMSNGEITISNVIANFNGNVGVIFNNAFATSGAGISLTGDNEFNSNASIGLLIISNGTLFVDPLEADGNNSGASIASTGGDVTIECAQFTNNTTYGLLVSTPGTLKLEDVVSSGNGVADFYFAGTTLNTSGACPPSIAASSSSDSGGAEGDSSLWLLDCADPNVFTLALDDGNHVLFSLLCGNHARLTALGLNALPAPVPDQYSFVSGLWVNVLIDGSLLDPLPEGATLVPSFHVTEVEADYAILYWDGFSWVEVAGMLSGDGYFQAAVDYTGIFVLVTE